MFLARDRMLVADGRDRVDRRSRRRAGAAVTTHTPVMGPNLLNASQLARWFNAMHGAPPNVPSLHNDVDRAGADLHRRRAASRECAATSRSCSRSSRPGWFSFVGFADPARRQQLRGDQRVRRPARPAELQARRRRAEPVLPHRARSACSRRCSCCAATPTRRRRPCRTG